MSSRALFPPQMIGIAQTAAIQEALKPHLHAVGVRRVEKRVGKPERFFANSRQRGKLKLQDLLATCAALGLDPVEFMGEALGDQLSPDIRPPRIVEAAWKQLHSNESGLGDDQLAEIEAALQSNPRQTRGALSRGISKASTAELPRILGLYGSCLRVESDLGRAESVLVHARDMAVKLDMPAAEAESLIRLAYVALEKDRLSCALKRAADALVISARIHDREGQGVGFLTMGTFRHYSQEHRNSLRDLEAALHYLTGSRERIATQLCRAHCFIALTQEEDAREAIQQARKISPQVDWMEGNLAWTEARLSSGTQRLELLMSAQDALSKRPADRALVTVELIDEALAMGYDQIADREAFKLSTLLEKTGNPRVERAIIYLASNHSNLRSEVVTKIRRAVEASQTKRLSRVIGSGG